MQQSSTALLMSPKPFFKPLMLRLGITLCFGGLAHSGGVVHFYATHGIPDVNRVLLDAWLAEAQIVGGVLYLVAYCAIRVGRPWQIAAISGALTVSSYAASIIPVMFIRDPVLFRFPPLIYPLFILAILFRAGSPSST